MTHSKELLRQLWKNGFFDSRDIVFSNGIDYEVVSRGQEIENSAADFSSIVLRNPTTGEIIRGGMRIDSLSSDWRKEGSLSESRYDGVVLHLVAQNDAQLLHQGSPLLCCELRAKPWIAKFYEDIAKDCNQRFFRFNALDKSEIMSQLLDSRIKRKTQEVIDIYHSVDDNWQECAYICLFKAIGTQSKVKDEFEKIARSINYSFIMLHSKRPQFLEAMFMGLSGFLDFAKDEPIDEYSLVLQKEFLASENQDGVMPAMVNWKQQRVRPASYPAVSLIRAIAVLLAHPNLFSLVTELDNIEDLRQLLTVDIDPYWKTHTAPSKGDGGNYGGFGGKRMEILLLNFVIPVLYARSVIEQSEVYANRAYRLYEEIDSEYYRKIGRWFSKEWSPRTAFESQAILQLVDLHCLSKTKCEGCPVAAKEMLRLWSDYQLTDLGY